MLAARLGPDARIVGVDLEPTDGIAPNVEVLTLDMCAPEALPAIQAALGRRADAVLCDASPKLMGSATRTSPGSRRSTWRRSAWPRRC